jgi:hypothetical protein
VMFEAKADPIGDVGRRWAADGPPPAKRWHACLASNAWARELTQVRSTWTGATLLMSYSRPQELFPPSRAIPALNELFPPSVSYSRPQWAIPALYSS